ncbi:hypothetical protein T4E_273 [Trichinella pseudospiralis]|uniref:Uncharacterized protein n=1 Tax=Trichinella pseudospiralis TaxID=6337 RepID=A0A0V0XPX3_TRIPS|nr:hypothetical protein T4E_273 [Trichinella pseudospiralis]
MLMMLLLLLLTVVLLECNPLWSRDGTTPAPLLFPSAMIQTVWIFPVLSAWDI